MVALSCLRQVALLGPSHSTQNLQHFAHGLRRRSGRGSRPLPVAQARRGISELLSLSKKSDKDEGDREPLKAGKVAPMLEVPPHIGRPPYADSGRMPDWDTSPQMHEAAGVERMRASGRLAAQVLQHAGSLVRPGVTTDEIDRAVHAMCVENGAYPSPLNYGRFPKSVCTSVNECICHGIPDSRPLAEGDIVNIDVTVFLKGYHGDTSAMFRVGEVSPEAASICDDTRDALQAGIDACGPGVPFKAIGAAIQAVADARGRGLVAEFVGHGVGTVFHSYPHIFHYRNNEPGVMRPGMTFTIEPMLTVGSPRQRMWKDGWTAVTVDGSLTAQYEHTLLITEAGVEVLTVA